MVASRTSFQKRARALVAAGLSAALALSLTPALPAFAADGDGQGTDIVAPATLEQGYYALKSISSGRGMVHTINDDEANQVFVDTDDTAYLVFRISAADAGKYDFIWKGTVADRPDPSTINDGNAYRGIPVPAAPGADKWVDEKGVYGVEGAEYGALMFVIPLTSEELDAGSVTYQIRRSPWTPLSKDDQALNPLPEKSSNAEKWMGESEGAITFEVGAAHPDAIPAMQAGKNTLDTSSILGIASKAAAVPTEATEDDLETYNTARAAWMAADYTNAVTYDFINKAMPELQQRLDKANEGIPNIVPADGTYEFLMNLDIKGDMSVSDPIVSDRFYNAKLVVKDGKMMLTVAQRRNSYSFLYLGDSLEAARKEGAVKDRVEATGGTYSVANLVGHEDLGFYDFKVKQDVYVDHPDTGESSKVDSAVTFKGPDIYPMYTATFPIESLEKPIPIMYRGGSKWYPRPTYLHLKNMADEQVIAVEREANLLLNDPDANDVEVTDPAYRIDPASAAENRAAIKTLQQHYNALSKDQKAAFDKQAVYFHVPAAQPYGRVLEEAVWGVEALDAVKNTTTLANGEYVKKLTARVTAGKALANDAADATWRVAKVTVKSGKATATIASEKRYAQVKANGKTYKNADTSSGSSFTIPVAIDGNTSFVAIPEEGKAGTAYQVCISGSAKAITSVTVNVATVNASAVAKAVKAASANVKYVTGITLGAKVKTIKAKAFAKCAKATTLTLKTTKLTKKSVKNSLKSSKVKTVKAPAKKVKAYKKIFTKAIAGKKVTVK